MVSHPVQTLVKRNSRAGLASFTSLSRRESRLFCVIPKEDSTTWVNTAEKLCFAPTFFSFCVRVCVRERSACTMNIDFEFAAGQRYHLKSKVAKEHQIRETEHSSQQRQYPKQPGTHTNTRHALISSALLQDKNGPKAKLKNDRCVDVTMWSDVDKVQKRKKRSYSENCEFLFLFAQIPGIMFQGLGHQCCCSCTALREVVDLL